MNDGCVAMFQSAVKAPSADMEDEVVMIERMIAEENDRGMRDGRKGADKLFGIGLFITDENTTVVYAIASKREDSELTELYGAIDQRIVVVGGQVGILDTLHRIGVGYWRTGCMQRGRQLPVFRIAERERDRRVHSPNDIEEDGSAVDIAAFLI